MNLKLSFNIDDSPSSPSLCVERDACIADSIRVSEKNSFN